MASLSDGALQNPQSASWKTLHTWKPIVPGGSEDVCVPTDREGKIGGSPDDFTIPEVISDTSEGDPCNPQTNNEWDPRCGGQTTPLSQVLNQIRATHNETASETRRYWLDRNLTYDTSSEDTIGYIRGRLLMARFLENEYIAVVEISRHKKQYNDRGGWKEQSAEPFYSSTTETDYSLEDVDATNMETKYCLLTSWEQKAVEGTGFTHHDGKTFRLLRPKGKYSAEGQLLEGTFSPSPPSGTFTKRCTIEWSPSKKMAVVVCWYDRFKADDKVWPITVYPRPYFGPVEETSFGIFSEYEGTISYLVDVANKTITKLNLNIGNTAIPAWTTEYGKTWAQ